MADDIAVTLLLTRDGIDVTSEVVGGRILNAPAGDYVATWTASNGVLPSVSKTDSLTVEAPPSGQVPTIIGGIADRTYTVGQAVPATDLRTKFEGATSYVISPALNWIFIDGYNLVFDTAASLEATSFSVRGVNADGQSEPVMFNLTVNVADQAPTVQTSPTITGSTTVGSILTRTAGTATGIPSPTRTTVWLRNGEVISGQTGNTLDTSGFAADDVITTRDDWTNSQGTASGTSAPWTLTVQPAITATIDLQPAGQQSSITFNVAIDGSPTIAQGSASITATRVGTTNQWTFVALVEGPISFAATKAGYTAFSGVFDVSPAAPQITTTSANTAQISNIDATTQPFSLTMTGPYAGTRTVTPSQMADGPVFHVAPSQTGTGAVGSEVLLDLGLVLNFASAGTAIVTWRLLIGDVEWQANGTSYTIAEADQGKSLVWEVTAEDANGDGPGPVLTNAIAVPGEDAPSLLALNSTNISWVNYAAVSSSPTSLHIQKALTTVSVWSYQVTFPIGTRIRMTLVTDHAISLRLGDNRDALNQVILGTYAAGTHQVDVIVDTLKPWFVIRAGNGSPAGTVTITNFHAA